MLPNVTLRDVSTEDVRRLAEWLQDEEISSSWFGYAGADPLHRGYDPLRMLEASDAEWDRVFRLDPEMLFFSIFNDVDEHIGECQVALRGKGNAEISLLIGRKDLWRQGYAASALTSLLDQLFTYYKLDLAWANVPKKNIAGLGLFTKLGFVNDRESDNFIRVCREKITLRDVDIFGGLSSEQAEQIFLLGKQIDVRAGQILGRAGDPSDLLYVIIDGQVELTAHSQLGDVTVRVAGPGESFPLATLIGTGRLITTATTMTDMKLFAIPRKQLLDLCYQDSEVGMHIYSAISDVLGTRYSRTLLHLTESAEKALKEAGFFANV